MSSRMLYGQLYCGKSFSVLYITSTSSQGIFSSRRRQSTNGAAEFQKENALMTLKASLPTCCCSFCCTGPGRHILTTTPAPGLLPGLCLMILLPCCTMWGTKFIFGLSEYLGGEKHCLICRRSSRARNEYSRRCALARMLFMLVSRHNKAQYETALKVQRDVAHATALDSPGSYRRRLSLPSSHMRLATLPLPRLLRTAPQQYLVCRVSSRTRNLYSQR